MQALIEGFLEYTKERLLRFHGVSRENLVFYLIEPEFRYNNKEKLYEMFYKVLSGKF